NGSKNAIFTVVVLLNDSDWRGTGLTAGIFAQPVRRFRADAARNTSHCCVVTGFSRAKMPTGNGWNMGKDDRSITAR
ncbi:MAG: hypothetical protein ACR2OE_05195, partial [Thermomicrobiales bacterium]